jgi:serine/threonine protein kinase/Flp pilus assembly protein TadD
MSEELSSNDKTNSYVALTAGTLVSHYRIINKIGSGGMGEVYLAEDTELDRQVALKFLAPHLCQDEECRRRFKREAQAAAKLDHPNIVTVHEVKEYQGRPFFAMAHVEGQSLREYAAGRELSADDVIELGIQLCEGLQAAHDNGVTHRDIKPSNILIDSHGRARIVDFGLASVVGKDQLTRTGSTLGTVGYMSPEQVQGKEIDHRSDLFSLGVVLYELITKQNPFKRDSDAATLKAVSEDTAEPLARYKREVPELLESIVAKLLEKNPAHRYQSAAGVVSDLRRLKQDSGSTLSARAITKRSITPLRIALPVFVVLVVVAVLVLKPWRFEVSPSHEVVAAENRLAIMYFDNLIDPSDSLRLGEIVTNLLITDLSESRYVQVVSSQRLYDLLKQLGHEGEKQIDPGMATQIAEMAGARWILFGSILSTKPRILVAAQLVDVASGDVLASQRVEGEPGDRIFSVVDKLTVEVKGDLSLPAEASAETDYSVATVSTNSPEALRLYLEGMDLFEKHYWSEADQCFTKAVELDSTYAVAYYRQAVIDYYFRNYVAAEAHIDDAMRYADRSGDKIKHYILSLNARLNRDFPKAIEELEYIIEKYPDEKGAYTSLGLLKRFETGELNEAIECFKKVVELDPYQREGYNQLAYAYNDIGEFEKSIWAINKYIEIAPDEANPYDSKGELLALNGKLDEAIASYEKAMELKPGFARFQLADLHLLRGDYTKAESLYRSAIVDGSSNVRAQGRMGLARIPLHQGKFRDAIHKLNVALETDRMESVEEGLILVKTWTRSHAEAYIGNIKEAADELDAAIESYQEYDPGTRDMDFARAYVAWWYAQLNRRNTADSIVSRLLKSVDNSEYARDSTAYWLGRAFVSQESGQIDTAVAYWQKSIKFDPSDFWNQLYLGISLLRTGQLGEAVSTLEKAMEVYSRSRAFFPHLSVEGHYWLAQAYEASGWTNKAIAQYETFLDIWKNADSGLTAVEDAKARVARLKTSL